MPFLKPWPRKIGVSTLWLASTVSLLISCSKPPPDVPVCSPNPAADYPILQKKFLKLCSEDLTCRPELGKWRGAFQTWTQPSDSGHCIFTISGRPFEVTSERPFGAEKKAWAEIASSSVLVPARESWAPLKTWIQTYCHSTGICDQGVGSWERTVESIDSVVKDK